MAVATATTAARKTALIMGVANRRSIAWACVQSFLDRDYNVIFTFQNERFQQTANDLIDSVVSESNEADDNKHTKSLRILRALPCQVETEIPLLFQQRIPEILGHDGKLDAIVHSIAFAPDLKQSTLLHTSKQAFQVAHDISTYSFLETAREALPLLQAQQSSLTTLSYIGAVRAVPHYSVMGPAKASLESLVRGLALEMGTTANTATAGTATGIRVNAVCAGPLNTLAAKGGIQGISEMRRHVEQTAPLRRNVTAREVADTVVFLATDGTGITGQTIYVDGGYSIISPGPP